MKRHLHEILPIDSQGSNRTVSHEFWLIERKMNFITDQFSFLVDTAFFGMLGISKIEPEIERLKERQPRAWDRNRQQAVLVRDFRPLNCLVEIELPDLGIPFGDG